jgi:hypothetical protein
MPSPCGKKKGRQKLESQDALRLRRIVGQDRKFEARVEFDDGNFCLRRAPLTAFVEPAIPLPHPRKYCLYIKSIGHMHKLSAIFLAA